MVFGGSNVFVLQLTLHGVSSYKIILEIPTSNDNLKLFSAVISIFINYVLKNIE